MFEPDPAGKRCSKCGVWRPLTEYYPATGCRDGLRGDCKACFKERAAARYRANPQPAKQRARDWAAKNPDRVKARMEADKASGRKQARDRKSYIWRAYGITEGEYERFLASGCCAICSTVPSGKARLHLDHDHTTGEIRGVLCFRCNNAIGDFSDSVGLLNRAIDYLSPTERPPEVDIRLAALKALRTGADGELLRQ
jgi:Autographiviridae endonuclease VII